MRDTNKDWCNIGEFEPYFGVLSHERFLRRNLTRETLAEFWLTGEHHMNECWNLIENYFGPNPKPKYALDFGCGVGRLTRAMASMAEHVCGVDVSSPMLEEAKRNDPPANIEYTFDIPSGVQIDWINSVIVFQHIPPERGYSLFHDLLSVAAPDALLSVHFMLFKDHVGVADQYFPHVAFSTWDGDKLRLNSR